LVIVDGSLLGAVALNRVVGFLEDSAVQERVGFGCCAILVPTKSLGNEWAAALPKYLNARFFESNDLEIQHRGVKILTIHSAKGLQFPVVAVVGLAGDTIGFIGPRDDPESADEVLRRLLFVACSRAMRHLLVQTSRSDPLALLSGAAARADLWNIESLSSRLFGEADANVGDTPI
jgi:superfamily I DNA/RNA helicase